jgi:phosphatidylinositol-4,5-bisphosphate 3-kinase
MMKKTGELFHIDFGHFLGNFKWKYGIKRERAPFVFTPAFAAVLGGEGSPTYKRFVELAVRAFNVLRKNSSLLVTLFSLMVSCGIPELQREEDIAYLRDNLMSGETDEVASQRLTEIISQCLHTRTTQLNDAVHLLVHA